MQAFALVKSQKEFHRSRWDFFERGAFFCGAKKAPLTSRKKKAEAARKRMYKS